MRGRYIGFLLGTAMLTACGGGGGVSSTPTPTPAPAPTPTPAPAPTPTPTPTSTVTQVPFEQNVLASNKHFESSAVRSQIDLDTTTAKTLDASVERNTVSVDYSAANGSYTVSFAGAQQTFGPGDRRSERFPGEASYFKTGTLGDAQFLTILSLPFISGSFASDLYYNRYVALGYWQVNQGTGSSQFMRFNSFIIGDRTAGSSVPTTGAAHWLVDIFGALAIEGKELLTVSGSGDFEVDFAAGAYQLNSFVDETNFLTIGGRGGALYFVSGGQLRADGTFGGTFAYDGSVSLDGTLEGAFFGPAAEEIGATFEAENPTAFLSGALTGQRSTFGATSDGVHNITLTDLLDSDGRAFGEGASSTLLGRTDQPGFYDIKTSDSSAGSAVLDSNGIVSVGVGTSQYVPHESDRIADPSGKFDRFAYYGAHDSTGTPADVEFAIYKFGPDNTEIPLTYMSFAELTVHQTKDEGAYTSTKDQYSFGHFGMRTSEYLIRAMTGSATYHGVVYGHAAGPDGYSETVGGTSQFDVDFSNDAYSGQLVLDGSAGAGGGLDFGTWDFAGAVTTGLATAELTNGTPLFGQNEIRPILYGPNAEELAASFRFSTQTDLLDTDYYEVAGITIATKD